MNPPYAELHCLSNFSFQRGASHPEELVTQAAAFGYAAIALTDECSLAGIVRAHRALQALPATDRPRLIIGSELQLADGPRIVLLATDRAGYGQLSRLITRARRAAGKGEYLLTRDMTDSLPGCLALLVPPPAFPPRAGTETACASLLADAEWLAGRFPGRAWITVTVRLDGRDRARITLLRRIARSAGIPALAASAALMHAPERRPLADVMTALRLHCSVAEAGLALYPDSEDVLVIAALVSEVQQDWAHSRELLEHLIKVQAGNTPPQAPPTEPLAFIKSPGTYTGHKQVTWRPDNVAYMHYECELVAVIGKQARNVKREDALQYLAGYTVCNDYAIRDYLENYYRPNLRVKNRDATTPVGPWIIDAAEVPEPNKLTLRTWVNGELRQQGSTADMIFDIPYLIEYLSSFMTLQPGDMIATGTPEGLADVVPGDEVVVEVEGVGRLVNRIVSEAEFFAQHLQEAAAQ